MLVRGAVTFVSCLLTVACASEWHPYTGHIRIYEESRRTGICALHHGPLVTINAYAYDYAFGAAIDWAEEGARASEKYPNVLDADQSCEKTKEYRVPIKVRICPICQQKFAEYMRKHPSPLESASN